MKDTAEQSALLKMALKHDPVTDELRAEAEAFPDEADEALTEVIEEQDYPHPGSWVDAELRKMAGLSQRAGHKAPSMGQLLDATGFKGDPADLLAMVDHLESVKRSHPLYEAVRKHLRKLYR